MIVCDGTSYRGGTPPVFLGRECRITDGGSWSTIYGVTEAELEDALRDILPRDVATGVRFMPQAPGGLRVAGKFTTLVACALEHRDWKVTRLDVEKAYREKTWYHDVENIVVADFREAEAMLLHMLDVPPAWRMAIVTPHENMTDTLVKRLNALLGCDVFSDGVLASVCGKDKPTAGCRYVIDTAGDKAELPSDLDLVIYLGLNTMMSPYGQYVFDHLAASAGRRPEQCLISVATPTDAVVEQQFKKSLGNDWMRDDFTDLETCRTAIFLPMPGVGTGTDPWPFVDRPDHRWDATVAEVADAIARCVRKVLVAYDIAAETAFGTVGILTDTIEQARALQALLPDWTIADDYVAAERDCYFTAQDRMIFTRSFRGRMLLDTVVRATGGSDPENTGQCGWEETPAVWLDFWNGCTVDGYPDVAARIADYREWCGYVQLRRRAPSPSSGSWVTREILAREPLDE